MWHDSHFNLMCILFVLRAFLSDVYRILIVPSNITVNTLVALSNLLCMFLFTSSNPGCPAEPPPLCQSPDACKWYNSIIDLLFLSSRDLCTCPAHYMGNNGAFCCCRQLPGQCLASHSLVLSRNLGSFSCFPLLCFPSFSTSCTLTV